MKVVVLQPMYLPWLGYFGLIDIADTFVFYDDVQFVRQTWQNRNRIKWRNGGTLWLTVPVQRAFRQTIAEVIIDNTLQWRNKHLECIKQAYANAPFFQQYAPILESLFSRHWDRLADLDTALIKEITAILGLNQNKFKELSNAVLTAVGNVFVGIIVVL